MVCHGANSGVNPVDTLDLRDAAEFLKLSPEAMLPPDIRLENEISARARARR